MTLPPPHPSLPSVVPPSPRGEGRIVWATRLHLRATRLPCVRGGGIFEENDGGVVVIIIGLRKRSACSTQALCNLAFRQRTTLMLSLRSSPQACRNLKGRPLISLEILPPFIMKNNIQNHSSFLSQYAGVQLQAWQQEFM